MKRGATRSCELTLLFPCPCFQPHRSAADSITLESPGTCYFLAGLSQPSAASRNGIITLPCCPQHTNVIPEQTPSRLQNDLEDYKQPPPHQDRFALLAPPHPQQLFAWSNSGREGDGKCCYQKVPHKYIVKFFLKKERSQWVMRVLSYTSAFLTAACLPALPSRPFCVDLSCRGCHQAVRTVSSAALPALAQSHICQAPRAVCFHRHEEEPVRWQCPGSGDNCPSGTSSVILYVSLVCV